MFWKYIAAGIITATAVLLVAGNLKPQITFGAIFDEVDSGTFVKASYQYLLKRNPDPTGFPFWKGLLDKKQLSRKDFLFALYRSNEYQIKNKIESLSDHDFIVFLYKDLLDRTANQTEIASWLKPIRTRNEIARGFIYDPKLEFEKRFSDFLKSVVPPVVPPSLNCRVEKWGKVFTGTHNVVGLSNGDTRFLCYTNKFYECGWELSDSAFAVKSVNNQQVGSWFCNLNNKKWSNAPVSKPLCVEQDWSVVKSPSQCPSTGQQTITWTKIGQCEGGVVKPESENINCQYKLPFSTTKYKIGLNYHSISSDFTASIPDGPFIRNYHLSGIRAKVKKQLQGMADAGADIIRTSLWMVEDSNKRSNQSWRLAFPYTDQEIENIKQYAQDVANIRANDGRYLKLELAFSWQGCADYRRGNPDTIVGYCNLNWAEFISRGKKAISDVISATASITRPDGQSVVEVLYFEGDVLIGAKANAERFYLDLYPYFVNETKKYDVRSSLDFTIVGREEFVFDDNFKDSKYPILNGHRSMYWFYRATEFLRKNNLPIPEGGLDASMYLIRAPGRVPTDYQFYGLVAKRILDDFQAVYPGYKLERILETWYPEKKEEREALGKVYVREFLKRGMPSRVFFWTTSNGGTTDMGIAKTNVSYPFDFASYKSCDVNLGATKYTGTYNTVGLSNGDKRFLCYNLRFYECGWEVDDPAFAVKMDNDQWVGDWRCDLLNAKWSHS